MQNNKNQETSSSSSSTQSFTTVQEPLSREKATLRDFIIHTIRSTEHNPFQGSLSLVHIENLLKSNYIREFREVFGDTLLNKEGHKLLLSLDNKFIISIHTKFYKQEQLSLSDMPWEEGNCNRIEAQIGHDRECLRELVEFLKPQQNPVLLDQICTSEPDNPVRRYINIFSASINKIRPGDFVRWARQQKLIYCQKDQEDRFVISLNREEFARQERLDLIALYKTFLPLMNESSRGLYKLKVPKELRLYVNSFLAIKPTPQSLPPAQKTAETSDTANFSLRMAPK